MAFAAGSASAEAAPPSVERQVLLVGEAAGIVRYAFAFDDQGAQNGPCFGTGDRASLDCHLEHKR